MNYLIKIFLKILLIRIKIKIKNLFNKKMKNYYNYYFKLKVKFV